MKSTTADFPDWFGPMLVKELRQGLRSRGFVSSFLGLQVLLLIVIIYHVLLYNRSSGGYTASTLGAVFWLPLTALLLLVTPLRALNALSGERRANTLELIFMSGLSAWRIAFGKWVALLFQALLFVLAVLPYFIVRYFFGRVDLAHDLLALSSVLLNCAALTAVALAVSGVPAGGRIAAVLLLVLAMGFLSPFLRLFGMSGAGFGLPLRSSNWWLFAWNILVLSLIALRAAAATVAPLAENHAGPQRFGTLLLWAPVPLLWMLGQTNSGWMPQLSLFAGVSAFIAWQHLSTRPPPMRSYAEPFAGRRAVLGLPFQPGWQGAVIFVLIAVFLCGLPVLLALDGDFHFLALPAMGGAALFSAAFFCHLCPMRNRLAGQTLILISGAVLAIFIGQPSTFAEAGSYGMSVLPPIAFWSMLQRGAGATWVICAIVALLAYGLLLIFLARPHWTVYFQHCREAAARAPGREPLPLPAL